jgi:hypothetical protein
MIGIFLLLPSPVSVSTSGDRSVVIVIRLFTIRSGIVMPAASGDLSVLQNALTSCGAQLASYSMDTSGPFPGSKTARREGYHLSPCSADVETEWSCNSTPPISIRDIYRGTFTFTVYLYLSVSFHQYCIYH